LPVKRSRPDAEVLAERRAAASLHREIGDVEGGVDRGEARLEQEESSRADPGLEQVAEKIGDEGEGRRR
jgi:hypothetical protein